MSIYKRNDTWWIQITTANGERIQRSVGTQVKQEAQELHDKMKAEAWRVKNLGAKPRHTWQEAVIRWLSERSHKKSLHTDKVHLRWLNAHLNNKHIDAIKQDKLKTGASNVSGANNHAWRKALIRADIKEFRWHDLRHTWASWHVQNGTPLNVLKELGGWADLTMVMRYAHLSSDHLKEYTGNASLKKEGKVVVLKEKTTTA
ncbi:tyrosine-type recombinase/integrase [Methylobacter psychrophilus]|uniref:tyrosine-type recombinase/integrase n=1 Tax=Methylobacter psychrophilus TaxID=96941 RepID=UPI0021D4C112|nr:tyrosine-type recombinase/integrase [Methylobacter psychrophilus]